MWKQLGDDETPDFYDNYIVANIDFINPNIANNIGHYNPNLDEDVLTNTIISTNQINEDTTVEGLRTFLPLNYYEMPRNRGEITNLESIGKVLLIHHEDGIYRTISEIRLDPSQANVVLGSGKIFDIEPEEVVTSKNGYAGLKHNTHALMTKAGYVFVDSKRKKIFLLSSNLEEISALGLKNWCNNNISETDEFSLGFDEKYNRILITNLTSPWTLSFNIETKTWTSYHSYTPDFYFNINDETFNIYSKAIYKFHDEDNPGLFYAVNPEESSIDFVINNDSNYNKLLQSIELSTIPIDKICTGIEVINSKQHSGELDITTDGVDKNTQYLRGKWNFNAFYDLVANSGSVTKTYEDNTYTLNPNKEWYDKKRFIDKYNVIRLINDNANQTILYLSDINVRQRISQL